MSFLSLINLKKDIKKVFTADNFTKLKVFIEKQIVSYVDNNELLGAEKKAKVDDAVVSYIKEHFNSSNTIVKLLVNLLVSYEPQISQYVYDLLKTYINGLTETVA